MSWNIRNCCCFRCCSTISANRTGTTKVDPGRLACKLPDNQDSNLETFLIYPKTGAIALYKTDFNLPGKPPIVFQRIYFHDDKTSRAFGLGTEHSYDSFLVSHVPATMHELEIMYGDTECYCTPQFARTSPGQGFSPDIVFEGEEDGRYFHSRVTWDGRLFVLKLVDGETYTYLPCSGNIPCYENGYRDAENNELAFTRNTTRSLTSLASQNTSLALSYDARSRISAIQDQSGNKMLYEYDDVGYLSKATASKGFVTTYEHAGDGHSFNVSVADKRHSKTTIFAAEFDNGNRILKAAVPDEGVYRFQYGLVGNEVESVLVTFPDNKKLRIRFHGDSYVAHSEN